MQGEMDLSVTFLSFRAHSSQTPWTAARVSSRPLCVVHRMYFFNYALGRPFNAGIGPKEEIMSQQQWGSLSVSGLEPMISVKAAAIAQGRAGPEGLAVRAVDLSPLQHASDSGKKQERRGRDDAPYVELVAASTVQNKCVTLGITQGCQTRGSSLALRMKIWNCIYFLIRKFQFSCSHVLWG